MKRLSLVLPSILFLFATASPVLAQTTLSLTGGLNRTTMVADPPDRTVWRSESLTRMSVGLAATFPASEHLGLEVGVAYSQKGGRLSGMDGDTFVTTELALDYFEFSLLPYRRFPSPHGNALPFDSSSVPPWRAESTATSTHPAGSRRSRSPPLAVATREVATKSKPRWTSGSSWAEASRSA